MAGDRHPRGFWERLLDEVEREGSVVEVAHRHGVKERTLGWWCWKLRGERRRGAVVAEMPRLLPVVLRDGEVAAELPRELALEWEDVRVRVVVGTDVGYVAALVKALRAC